MSPKRTEIIRLVFERENKEAEDINKNMIKDSFSKYRVMPGAKCWDSTTKQYELALECDGETLMVMLDTASQNFRHAFTAEKGLKEFHSVMDMFELIQEADICTVDSETGALCFKYEKVMGKKKWEESFRIKLDEMKIETLFQMEKEFRKVVRRQMKVEQDLQRENEELRNELHQFKKEVKEQLNELRIKEFDELKERVRIQNEQIRTQIDTCLAYQNELVYRSMESLKMQVTQQLTEVQQRHSQYLMEVKKSQNKNKKRCNKTFEDEMRNKMNIFERQVLVQLHEKIGKVEQKIRQIKKKQKLSLQSNPQANLFFGNMSDITIRSDDQLQVEEVGQFQRQLSRGKLRSSKKRIDTTGWDQSQQLSIQFD